MTENVSESSVLLDSPNPWHRLMAFMPVLVAGTGAHIANDQSWNMPPDEELEQTKLKPEAEAFMLNRQRLQAMAQFPVAIFDHGRQFHHHTIQLHLSQDLTNAQWHTALQEWVVNPRYNDQVTSLTNFDHVASVVAFEPEKSVPAARAFCESLVIQAWSLFESLAEDIWVKAVNEHPARLAGLRGVPPKSARNTQQQKKEEMVVSISRDDLEKYHYDLSKRMGDVLVTRKKVSFRTLAAIREAYYRAFDKNSGSVTAVIDDKRLQYMAAVRNVLVHKAGRVDDNFFRQITDVTNTPDFYPLTKHFPLTGKIAAELCDATMWCSAKLIRAVHTWLLNK